jgi:hypothetical protein
MNATLYDCCGAGDASLAPGASLGANTGTVSGGALDCGALVLGAALTSAEVRAASVSGGAGSCRVCNNRGAGASRGWSGCALVTWALGVASPAWGSYEGWMAR